MKCRSNSAHSVGVGSRYSVPGRSAPRRVIKAAWWRLGSWVARLGIPVMARRCSTLVGVIDASRVCRCVLCHDYGDRDENDRLDEDTIADVRQFGWSVLMIPEDDLGPGWAYTIGLWHSHGAPELAMFGLDIELMRTRLNALGKQAVAGQHLAAGQQLATGDHLTVGDHLTSGQQLPAESVHLKSVDLRWCRPFFGRIIGFYRRPLLPFLQAVWPDSTGLYPWDAGSDEVARSSQPQLWLSPAEHPQGVWTQDL